MLTNERIREQDTALIRQMLEALERCRFDSLNMSLQDLRVCKVAADAARARLQKESP